MENKITKRLVKFSIMYALLFYPLLKVYGDTVESRNIISLIITGLSIGLVFMAVGLYIGYSDAAWRTKQGEVSQKLRADKGFLTHLVFFITLNLCFLAKYAVMDKDLVQYSLILFGGWAIVVLCHYAYSRFSGNRDMFE